MVSTLVSTPPEGRVPARWRWITLAVLSLAFIGIGLGQAAGDAPTVDEGVDVSSGVAALVRHDLRMVPEHPVLPKAVAALPALLAHPIVPDTAAYRNGEWFEWSDDFISANADAGRLDDVLLWARGVVLLEAVACAVVLYLLATRFFGPDGGLLVAVAWLTTPYVVGIGHFAMIDVAFTLATLAGSLALVRWLEEPSRARTVQLGAVMGLVLATRHTGLVLLAVALLVVAVNRRHDRAQALRDVGVAGLVSVITVWAVYRGLAPSGPSGVAAARFDGIIGAAGDGSVLTRLVTAVPLPKEWRVGFAYLDLTSTPRPASLLGRSWNGGRWWYFPVSAALKVPLTLSVAVVGGWAVAVARTRRRPQAARVDPGADVRDRPTRASAPAVGAARVDGRRLATVVALPGLVLWAFLAAQPLNLGLRLALPVLALSYVGLGALADLARPALERSVAPVGSARRRRPRGAVAVAAGLVVVLLVQVSSSVAAVPHSLAWMPVPFTPGYRWVSDANLDAGQSLYEVRDWAEAHDRPYVALDATRGMEVGGGSRSLRGVDPADVRGWVAVGVTPLMQTRKGDDVARGELAWLRRYCPVATLGGGSVLVYRFDVAPDPRPGPERPVEPCIGASFSARSS